MSIDVRVSRSLKDLVSEEIRAMMGRRRMSANTLAKALDKSDMYVSRRLRGATPFDVDDLERIAEVLGVPVTQLFGEAATNAQDDTGGYRGDDEITHSDHHLLTKTHLMRPRRPVRLTPRTA